MFSSTQNAVTHEVFEFDHKRRMPKRTTIRLEAVIFMVFCFKLKTKIQMAQIISPSKEVGNWSAAE